jgi:hypothetical protein
MTSRRAGRRDGRGARRLAAPALALAMLLGLGSPVAAATPSSVVLRYATYAVATATHDRPAHVVSAIDVSNAVSALSTISNNLALFINLGDVLGYRRLAVFIDQSTFTNICASFPDSLGGVARIIPCPLRAIAQRSIWPDVLQVSERAIVTAAAHGKAVSGADVVASNRPALLTLVRAPTFLAGEGGQAKFATTIETSAKLKFTVYVCVRFPKTAYGIPVQVAC